MNKGELNRILKGRGTLTPEESTKIRSILKEIIAQQDYIVIDWEGTTKSTNPEKAAEVEKIIKNIYRTNPIALLSIIFKNYGAIEEGYPTYSKVVAAGSDDGTSFTLAFLEPDGSSGYTFDL